MAVDFTWLDEKKCLEKVTVTDSGLQKIERALSELSEKTGLYIDPYADTRVSPDHAQLLRTLINKECSGITGELEDLSEFLQRSSEEKRWILVVGD